MFWRRRTAASQSEAETSEPQARPGGHLGRHGLTAWWDSTFTDEERTFLESYLAPLLRGNASWRTGTLPQSTQSDGSKDPRAEFLSGLAGFLTRSDRAPLAVRLLDKAREYELSPIQEHFTLMAYIEVRYKQRETDPEAIGDVIHACERMIAIAPAVIEAFRREHEDFEQQGADLFAGVGEGYRKQRFPGVGNNPAYKRLAIIRKKQGDVKEAKRIEKLYHDVWEKHTIDYKRAKSEARKAARKRA